MRPDAMRRLLAALVLILSGATAAWGHGLSVFAWVEGERVLVESKFSGGKRPVGATVQVLDPQGNTLLSGTTDAEGRWSFDLPQRTALKIVLEAGMGHRGEWTIGAAEVGAPPSDHSAAEPPPQPHPPAPTADATAATADLDARLRKAVAEELAPVTARLARLEERLQGPSLQDILGGLGYILGLVGIAAYIQARRRQAP